MNKYKFLGSILHVVYRILSFMTRKEYFYADGVKINEPNIIVFWHRKIFTVCNATRVIDKKASIVSASKDGEILAELLRREGNELIRGSSNRDNIKSLKEAMKYAKQECRLFQLVLTAVKNGFLKTCGTNLKYLFRFLDVFIMLQSHFT